MPAVTDPHNVYAAAGAGMLSDAARAATPLVYVPHTRSGDVWVLDPATFAVVGRYELGRELQHVVPSYDLTTLYASDDQGNTLTPFDPRTGRPGPSFPVTDPYHLYFTPDGRSAISVAERRREDMPTRNTRMGPQDIKLAPDGSVFYIADHDQGGVWVLDGAATTVLREIPTGHGTHGLYLSRDAGKLYVTTGTPAPSRCSTPTPAPSRPAGRSPAAAARTWAT